MVVDVGTACAIEEQVTAACKVSGWQLLGTVHDGLRCSRMHMGLG